VRRTHKSKQAGARRPSARRIAAPAPATAATVLQQAAEDDDDRRPASVQSIGRAFAILEEVARNPDGIGLAELSKRVGLHNSTTFHLVKSMLALGYIRQPKDDKRYRVGRNVFTLAANSFEVEMKNLATPILEDLSSETGESAHFAVRMGDLVVVIARTWGSGAFQLTDRVGVVRPAHCTALGKVILASLTPPQLDRVLGRLDMRVLTPKTITDVGVLRHELEGVRTSGIAYDDGEFDTEARCIAVPIRNFTGQVIGAIGISGPVWRLSIQALQSHARVVQAAARRLSAEFGAPRVLDAAAES